jgi:amidase
VGKTISVEISLGILGDSRFDGTPLNTLAPDRVPGGSSSGSAAAVAGNLCDFALGSDTGGSVRVPASFCGVYGIRPTHGRVNSAGLMPQAPSSDTVGWLTSDATILRRVSEVIFNEKMPDALPKRLVVAVDAFKFASTEVAAALRPMIALLGRRMEVTEEVMAPAGIDVWGAAQRTLQRYEAWMTFREWIDRFDPRLSFSVARNLAFSAQITEEERNRAARVRSEAQARMADLLPQGTILCMPTTPFPAPEKGQPLSARDPLMDSLRNLCSHGGLTGVPQISLPGTTVGPLPVGLSIVGGRGSDMTLVAVACAVASK